MKIRHLVLLSVLFIPACSSTPAPPPSYNAGQPGTVVLDIRDLNFVDRSKNQPTPPQAITNRFQPSIADAVRRWTGEHLQAVGVSGQGNFVVTDAYVVEQPLAVGTGMDYWFSRQQGSKYTGHVQVEFDVNGNEGFASASAHAMRSVSLPENPTEEERRAAYNEVLDGLMHDLGINIAQAIQEHMHGFVVTAPLVGNRPPGMPQSYMPPPELPGISP